MRAETGTSDLIAACYVSLMTNICVGKCVASSVRLGDVGAPAVFQKDPSVGR